MDRSMTYDEFTQESVEDEAEKGKGTFASKSPKIESVPDGFRRHILNYTRTRSVLRM